MWKNWIIPLLSVAFLGLATYHLVRTSQPAPRLDPPIAPARAGYGDLIGGVGLVEPKTENISLGAHVSGVVSEVLVQVGQKVEAGQPLYRIDSRQQKAEIEVRRAMLVAMQAQLQRLQQMPRTEELPPSEAKVREAEANLVRQADLLERGRKLLTNRVLTQEEMIAREQAHEVARQQLTRAQAEHQLLLAGAWAADKKVAEANVLQSQAELQRLEVELDRLTVKAPISAEILQLNVRPGEYVATPSSQNLITLGDVRRLRVRVDIDEHDIPRLKPDREAWGMVRGAAEQKIPLRFVRVEPFVIPKKSLTGLATERVDTRVLQVIYELDPTPPGVFVGQQMDVFVRLDESPAPSTPESASMAEVKLEK